ncbi:S16 family serine protease [Streptomyces sp. TRM 70361]|uniref:S16 family serine protease n=1 Tax=Streptomyces sp. TRM 70361 TaxID=3116553 RepID=UPI002E7B5F57|nr:S16 family serine protease [Streptomyces sp. TRM 70361]MEE1937878.1 S16 family serine protease [Streptomyces sp. TRM 70361]
MPAPTPRALSPRARALSACGAAVAALLAVAALAPLPFSVAQPGITANVLGEYEGEPVITVSGVGDEDPRADGGPEGKLLATTIAATAPGADVRLADVVGGWLDTDRAVMPRDAVYPVGDDADEIEEYTTEQMVESQEVAVTAALRELEMSEDEVEVDLRLEDVGGPSAGLVFALGVIDEIDDGDLTGGLTIAGTGTIDGRGEVGPVGGVPLKTQAAARDGATVFLVPEAECEAARVGLPDELRLVPVTTLGNALRSLRALRDDGHVPSC